MLIKKSLMVGFYSGVLLLQGATNFKVVGRYPIPGVGGFDYVTLDNMRIRPLRSPIRCRPWSRAR